MWSICEAFAGSCLILLETVLGEKASFTTSIICWTARIKIKSLKIIAF